ncbi:MAG: ATP-binding cassette domain-containing protein, partial [Rhodoblastus sp.]|nr:ATP-binding cassette domain-containing protein [Rhodoblastus sp.]
MEPPADAATHAVKVDIRKVDFYYGANRALKDISLPLRANEVTAFIGPSGCGKST